MKTAELRELSAQRLQEELAKLLQEKFDLSLQLDAGQLKQNHLIRVVKRQIARIKTLLQEKQRGEHE